MRNQTLKSAGIFLLAAFMLASLNAQSPNKGGNGTVQAQGNRYEFGPRHEFGPRDQFGPRQEKMAQHFSLDLSEEQQVEMKTLKSAHYKTMKPLQNNMLELKARERTLLSEENIEMKAVYKVIDEQTDLMNKIKKLQVDHQLKAKSILNDEQVMKLEQRRNFVMQKRSDHRRAG